MVNIHSFFKNASSLKRYSSKLFLVAGLKDEKVDKKANLYVKTETCKLYSGVS